MTPRLPEAPRPSVVRTFLIADIRGYTRFTNELGDEAGSRLAAKFAQVSFECVEAHGGVVLELRGDEAMCVFDSARAALRCAVELQDAFADETRVEPHLPLRVGIGLDAGEAVPVGDGYRGSAINLAARLCSAAQAGDVIATEGLVHLAGRLDGLTYATLDGRPLKGFDEPVSAWLVSAERPHDHPDTAAGNEPAEADPLPSELDAIVPLVGREADLRWLGWYWRRARHGHGGAVAISGPPGIGRTRLAAEMAAQAQGQGASARYVQDGEELELPDGPALVVVDDLERMATGRARGLVAQLASNPAQRLVILTHGDGAPSSVRRQVERIVPAERRRVLRPLDAAAVNQVARLYLERPEDEPPTQLLLEESEGIPAAIHRVASQWARAAAARRLGESARRTSRERRDLRAAEAAMIDDVERLELTRERSRLYVATAAGEGQADTSAAPNVCPYKGLAPFAATDAEYYFGRDRLVAELIARMVGSSFVGLIGASGSGKSSALRAGLLPALAGAVIPGSDEWIQVVMRPGDRPMRELQRALHRGLPQHPSADAGVEASLQAALDDMAPAQRLLIVVDQFEELFTSIVDDDERQSFIDTVTQRRSGLKVLVALRADQYEHCAAYPVLARLIGADQVLVGPLTATEIAAIIRHPAERAGLRVEPELVAALVADIGTEPGGLPLLSTALLELWELRDGNRLTLAAYRATGGVRSAVARLADAAYLRLDPGQQAEARSIFLRLAGETDARDIVRRRVPLDELDLAGAPHRDAVLAALVSGRLLTASEGYVEVAHEALLREWPRLRSWIEEDSSGRHLRLHLTSAARAWGEGGRELGDLYRGARLAAALDWSTDHGDELNALERVFIDESRAAADRETERQRRTNRRLRVLLAAAGAMLVVAVGAGVVAVGQADRADAARAAAEKQAVVARDAEDLARSEERRARGRELHASAITAVERDPELTILLIREAIALGVPPPPEAVTALHQAVQASRTVMNVTLPTPAVPPATIGVALSPDGKRLYTSTDSASVEVRDVESGELLEVLGTPREETRPQLLAIAVSPDGRTLAYVDDDAVLHLWDTESGTERTIRAPGVGTDWPAFDQDGQRIATITWENEERSTGKIVAVFDVPRGELIREWRLDGVYVVGFHEDGRHLLATDCVCAPERAFVRLDIESDDEEGEPFENIEGITNTGPEAAQFSPDGRLMATAGRDGKINLWSTDDGSIQDTFIGHTQGVTYLAFSRDGTRLASTSTDGSTRIWDTERGEARYVLRGQAGRPGSAAFSADAELIVTGSSNLTARVWSLSPAFSSEGWAVDLGPEFENLRATDVRDGLIGVYGRPCLAGCWVGPVAIFDPEVGRITARLDDLHQGGAILLLRDGTGVVFQPGEAPPPGQYPDPNAMQVHDTVAGGGTTTLEPICNALAGVRDCVDPVLQVQHMALSPDGTRAAATGISIGCDVGAEGTCEPSTLFCWFGVWALDDGRLLYVRTAAADGCNGPVGYSPDGTMLATGGGDRISVMDASTFEVIQEIAVGDAQSEFSPDGSLLVVASGLTRTRIYDTRSWEYQELDATSFGAAFTSDGRRIITGDLDRFLRLWDVQTNTELQRIPGGEAFDSWRGPLDDETMLMSTGSWLQVVTFDVDALLEEGISRLSRELNEDECERYLHGPCAAVTARSE